MIQTPLSLKAHIWKNTVLKLAASSFYWIGFGPVVADWFDGVIFICFPTFSPLFLTITADALSCCLCIGHR